MAEFACEFCEFCWLPINQVIQLCRTMWAAKKIIVFIRSLVILWQSIFRNVCNHSRDL